MSVEMVLFCDVRLMIVMYISPQMFQLHMDSAFISDKYCLHYKYSSGYLKISLDLGSVSINHCNCKYFFSQGRSHLTDNCQVIVPTIIKQRANGDWWECVFSCSCIPVSPTYPWLQRVSKRCSQNLNLSLLYIVIVKHL